MFVIRSRRERLPRLRLHIFIDWGGTSKYQHVSYLTFPVVLSVLSPGSNSLSVQKVELLFPYIETFRPLRFHYFIYPAGLFISLRVQRAHTIFWVLSVAGLSLL